MSDVDDPPITSFAFGTSVPLAAVTASEADMAARTSGTQAVKKEGATVKGTSRPSGEVEEVEACFSADAFVSASFVA